MKKIFLAVVTILSILPCHAKAAQPLSENHNDVKNDVYKDPSKSIDERIADLISRMTLEEKVSQMLNNTPAIKRLDIPEYEWWNECLHGVARSGRATVFPQAIGLAATFDEDLIFRIAAAISDEARAMHHAAAKKGYRIKYAGLTFWTPNINIFRDPRWGRGQETYGEDPYLTSVLGTAFVKGLQGNHPVYLKAAACAKHYVVHSGPEPLRHSFNAEATAKDMYETYLPAFKALVEAGVEAVMCAYNRTNDELCCGSKTLLGTVLREQWGFKGHIVSDCGALRDFHRGHNRTESAVESAAMGINSGVNLNCGRVFGNLVEAVEQGLVTEETIDNSLAILLRTRFKLGLFDPPELNPYTSIPTDIIRCDKHRQLAREAAAKSIVLLKNHNNVLPLKKDARRLFVTGPFATSAEVLLGNYYGVSDEMVTILEGITGKIEPGSSIEYRQGFLMDRKNIGSGYQAASRGRGCDASIVVMGISALVEGEQGRAIASPGEGDRDDIGLPVNQINFLKKMREQTDNPIIVVLTGGSPFAMPQIHELADAILFVWYPGEQGGKAVGDVLFGDTSPSGRLPVTFPKSVEQLPPFEDYSMAGRTYRYMTEEPLYPFGFGLSYTHFEYSNLKLDKTKIKRGDSVNATVTIKNTGPREGDEIVQLYMSDIKASTRTPLNSLEGIKCINLKTGQSQTVEFTITPEMMALVNDEGQSILESGQFKITIGSCSPGQRGLDLGASKPVEMIFTLE
jgi:beta-glucosidase